MDWIGMAAARHQLADTEVNSIRENQQIKHYPVEFIYNFYTEANIIEGLKYRQVKVVLACRGVKKQTISC